MWVVGRRREATLNLIPLFIFPPPLRGGAAVLIAARFAGPPYVATSRYHDTLARLPGTSEQEKGGSNQSGKVGRGVGGAAGIGGIGRGSTRIGVGG